MFERVHTADTQELLAIGFTGFVNTFNNLSTVRHALYRQDNADLLFIQCAEDFRESLNRKLHEARNKLFAFKRLDKTDNLNLNGTMYWIKAINSVSELMVVITSELSDPDNVYSVVDFIMDSLFNSYDLSKSVTDAWLALTASLFLPEDRYDLVIESIDMSADIGNLTKKKRLKNCFLRHYGLLTNNDLYPELYPPLSYPSLSRDELDVFSKKCEEHVIYDDVCEEHVISDDECDKDFWYWAFDNAPKALLNESYNMLYSNMSSQYAKVSKRSNEDVIDINTPLGQALEELKSVVGSDYVFLNQISSVLKKIFHVVDSVRTMDDDGIYIIHASTNSYIRLSGFCNMSTVHCFQDTYGEYLLFTHNGWIGAVLISVSSKHLRTVIDLYNDWDGTSLQKQADELAELVGIEE